MAKDETTPGGIFSKVVKFVRNPGTNWTDLDQKESDRESTYSKQALKEMIERKRRNDFVRKREFDMLRKLRRREAMGVPGAGDGSARPSFFQSSMPSKPDDRAMTLKKIDEIEAQMSMQWWKTKHGGGGASILPASVSSFGTSDLPQNSLPEPDRAQSAKAAPVNHNLAYARTAPDNLSNALAASAAQAEEKTSPAPFSATPVAASPTPAASPVADSPAPVRAAPPAAARPAPVAPPKTPIMGNMAGYSSDASSGFSASKMFAMDVDEVQHDPELEEAAIRFANGDDDGAEAGLLEALGPTGTRGQHEETWFAAFDMYRAIGRHDSFESLAIDFAGKFGRSAPIWFSMPDLVGKTLNPDAVIDAGTPQKSDWRSPGNFGVQTLAALNAALLKASAPWALDWSILKTIEDNAVVPLSKLFASWATQPTVQLRFIGAENIENVLKNATPSNDRSVNQDLWKLRLEHLRITHRPDEFELAALDFCVTYEVSPPSWENARCDFKALDRDGMSGLGNTIIGDAMHDSIQSEYSGYDDGASSGLLSGQLAQLSQVELSGQIQGDPVAMLDKLEAKLAGADVMVISCAKLMRVDFSAAGTLLNWVSARQSEGRVVHFTDVHRLVAAFFHVIGISEHAKVTTRLD
jgi:ABC-type transporter Mla MlaB component